MAFRPPVGKEGDSNTDLGLGTDRMSQWPEVALLMISIQDNAGKTTLLYRLKVRGPLGFQSEPE